LVPVFRLSPHRPKQSNQNRKPSFRSYYLLKHNSGKQCNHLGHLKSTSANTCCAGSHLCELPSRLYTREHSFSLRTTGPLTTTIHTFSPSCSCRQLPIASRHRNYRPGCKSSRCEYCLCSFLSMRGLEAKVVSETKYMTERMGAVFRYFKRVHQLEEAQL